MDWKEGTMSRNLKIQNFLTFSASFPRPKTFFENPVWIFGKWVTTIHFQKSKSEEISDLTGNHPLFSFFIRSQPSHDMPPKRKETRWHGLMNKKKLA